MKGLEGNARGGMPRRLWGRNDGGDGLTESALFWWNSNKDDNW